MRDFRNLDVWHKSHALTLKIHRTTDSFPKTESFGLSAILRRGSANMTMKIAEGCGRDELAQFHQCLQQARGIGMELEYQLLLARDLQFIEPPAYDALQHQVIEVRKMLTGLIKSQGV